MECEERFLVHKRRAILDSIIDSAKIFELEKDLPNESFDSLKRRLIGFKDRYEKIWKHLQLLINSDEFVGWSKSYHGQVLPFLEILKDRYPLVIFHGDVGTGKTVFAETICNQLCRDMKMEAKLFKLSTRVRGEGLVGQMSELVNRGFNIVFEAAGKFRYSFIVLDEGDSLAASRSMKYSHQEDKVGVNTLIQKIDEGRKFNGRVLIFICTNRFHAIDPAILRRASLIEHFERPNESERMQLFRNAFSCMKITEEDINELVQITGANNGKIGFTYSDITTRLVPEAIICAFPDRELQVKDLIETARRIEPTPSIEE